MTLQTKDKIWKIKTIELGKGINRSKQAPIKIKDEIEYNLDVNWEEIVFAEGCYRRVSK